MNGSASRQTVWCFFKIKMTCWNINSYTLVLIDRNLKHLKKLSYSFRYCAHIAWLGDRMCGKYILIPVKFNILHLVRWYSNFSCVIEIWLHKEVKIFAMHHALLSIQIQIWSISFLEVNLHHECCLSCFHHLVILLSLKRCCILHQSKC